MVVVVLGALATIATSAPEPEGVRAEEEFELAALEVAHIDVRFDATTMDHARRYAEVSRLILEVRVRSGADVRVITDDGAMPPQSGGYLMFGLDACPAEGGCTLGLSLEASEDARVLVGGAMDTAGDPTFVLPESREYPADATVTVERSE